MTTIIRSLLEYVDQGITNEELDDLEKFGDHLLNQYGIDIEFTRHFGERMNDSRNRPPIKISEIQSLFKKIEKDHAEKLKKIENEAVIVDVQSKLNLPFVIKIRRGVIDIVMKTIMRKTNFLTPDAKVVYWKIWFTKSFSVK